MKKSIPLIAGNWKCNPKTEAQALALAVGVSKLHKNAEAPYVLIAPTDLHLAAVAKKVAKSSVMVASQNVSPYTVGAHTGEQAVSQAKDAGATFVIIGHSERRAAGVTDMEVLAKLQAVLAAKLIPIVCIGEQNRDRNGNFFKEIEKQIRSFASELTSAQLKKVVIAYEPIWAIGTGKTASSEQAQDMHKTIRKYLATKFGKEIASNCSILYGGSCKPSNAKELFANKDVDGGLIGGASLVADDFIAIIKAI